MMTRVLCSVAALALSCGAAHAQYGGYDWGGGSDWGDWGDWDDADSGGWFDTLFGGGDDNREDPSRHASAIDIDFEPDEILALNLTRDSLAIAQRLGFRVLHRSLLKNLRLALYRLSPPRGMTSRQALAALREADPKGYYDRNTLYRLAGAGSGHTACEGVRCYGQNMIGWREAGCAIQTRIGMLDTAVDLRHPALAGRRIRQQRLLSGRPRPSDSEHGTAVAALLVGAAASGFAGLLPDAELIAADVFATDRKGRLYTDAALLARGLDWVAGERPGVINLSISGPDSGVLHTAIRRAVKSGIVVVAAAGNQGPVAPPQYPAAYPDVIAVTAVDRHRQIYAQANHGKYVALSAPGVGIWTAGANGAGVFRDGTSFAAPFATAEAALLRTRQPELPPAELKAKLRRQARRLGRTDNDPVFGAGLLQSQGCQI